MRKKRHKHTVKIGDTKTSISLEDAFWELFKEAAAARGMSLNEFAEHLHGLPRKVNLCSDIRVFLLNEVQDELAKAQALLKKAAARLDLEEEETVG